MAGMETSARQVARTVVDGITADTSSGQFEVYSQVAIPIPTMVTCDMLDLEPEVAVKFQRWTDEFNHHCDPRGDRSPTRPAGVSGTTGTRASRIRRPSWPPSDNPFDALCQAWIDGATIDGRPVDAQVVGFLLYVLYDGSVDTTSAAIAVMEVLFSRFEM